MQIASAGYGDCDIPKSGPFNSDIFLYSIYKDEILNNSLLITDWDSSATKVGGKVPVLQACETRKSPGVGVVVVGPSVVVKAGVVDVAPGCTPLIFFNAQRNFSLTSLLVNASI